MQHSNPQVKIKKSNRTLVFITVILIIILAFGAGYIFGLWERTNLPPQKAVKKMINQAENQELASEMDFNLFWEVWGLIDEKHLYQPVDSDKMFYGALTGLAASLDDPYSVYLDPELSEIFTQEINGTFEGIGAEIGIKDNQLMIVAPLPNTPAAQAGLKPGDKIIAIDDIETTNMSLDYAVNLIRGNKDTIVNLKVIKVGTEEISDVPVTRAEISVPSVTWEMKDDIAYIEIAHFNSDTAVKFNQAEQEILAKNPKKLILDLRNNPGGYLDQAIDIASQFVDEGVIVYEEFSDRSSKEYRATGNAQLADLEVVVLVNRGSASASEIVAGALQDYELATIVGETTFGKGSVQDFQQFSDGSSLKLTVAKWLTPKGNSIDEQGIIPSVVVELTEEDYNEDRDPQLDKAIELLNE